MKHEFSHLKSVHVTVEERRTGTLPGAGGWRMHEYSGLQAIPERLRPAFNSPGTGRAAEVNLLVLLRAAYEDGLTVSQHQADYLDGAGCDKATVSRAINLRLSYEAGARAKGHGPDIADIPSREEANQRRAA